MTPRRLEQVGVKGSNVNELGESPESCGALSGADKAISGDCDPGLQQVIDAWQTLPEAARQDIVAMIKASAKGGR
jgi:hypothetical protein